MLSSRISNAWSLPHRRSIAGDKEGKLKPNPYQRPRLYHRIVPRKTAKKPPFLPISSTPLVWCPEMRGLSPHVGSTRRIMRRRCEQYIDPYALLRMTARTCDASLRDTTLVERALNLFCLFSDGGAQLFDDFMGRLAGGVLLGDGEGDGADAGVASSAVALADLRQVYSRL